MVPISVTDGIRSGSKKIQTWIARTDAAVPVSLRNLEGDVISINVTGGHC